MIWRVSALILAGCGAIAAAVESTAPVAPAAADRPSGGQTASPSAREHPSPKPKPKPSPMGTATPLPDDHFIGGDQRTYTGGR